MDRVAKNLPLAKHFATRWPQHPRIAPDEILGAAYAGLISGDAGYDPAEGYSYSTYTYAAMRSHVRRYIGDRPYGPFHVPSTAKNTEAGRVAAARVARCETIEPGTTDPADYRARLSVPEHVDLAMMAEHIGRALDQLPGRWREVIRLLYFKDMTMPEVAERLGLTRQRIHQIEAKALERIRWRLPNWK